jgi:hypothetical protein
MSGVGKICGVNGCSKQWATPARSQIGGVPAMPAAVHSRIDLIGRIAMNCGRRGLEISACSFVATPLRAVAMAWLILCAGALHAAIITVVNNNDSGAGSLRAAVASASPGDTIVFAPIPSPITLTSGEIVIGQNLTITGPGAGVLTVSVAGKSSRVFDVTTGTVTISNLTISGGSDPVAGGGIFNNGTLTLQDATVSGNAANLCCGGGIYNNTGTMTINNVTVSGNHTASAGGGIGNAGTMTITNSTVSGGSAGGAGGGIGNAGTMTISYTTVSGNNANGVGGGIDSNGAQLTLSNSTVSGNSGNFGGGIAAEGAATITNSTISGNMAATEGAGIDVLVGATTLTNVTIAANGSAGEAQLNVANANGAAATVESTIIANPLAGGNNCSGVVPTSAGFNLDSANSCAFGTPTDLINTNPLLGPLAINGGPTLTLALLPGSPAINKGANPLALAFDQRGPGFARVSAGGTDIGAFEVQVAPGAPASVPTLGGVALLALAALSALFAVAPLHRRRVRR